MISCQDCDEKEATTLIFDLKKIEFFTVCDDCIKEKDIICPENLIKKLMEEKWKRKIKNS